MWSPLFPETHLGTFFYSFSSVLKHSWKCKRQAEFLINAYFGNFPEFKHKDLFISVTFSDLGKLISTVFIDQQRELFFLYMSHPLIFLAEKSKPMFQTASRSIKLHYHLSYTPGSIIGLIIHHVYLLSNLYTICC